MNVVTEVISSLPFDQPELEIQRDEKLLFDAPPDAVTRLMNFEPAPLEVYTVPIEYEPMDYAPPRGVFEGPILRLEWQTIDGRQPIYHRNADGDEIGYQICGERTLMTERGTMEFGLGQFASIPAGVAHDNYGRRDIHLIFYLHGPAKPGVEPVGYGEYRMPPFPGWKAKPAVEAITGGLGSVNSTIACTMADEALILNAASEAAEPLAILEPNGPAGETEWVYRAPKVWIGHTRIERTTRRNYRRYVSADEIQFQAEGSRTVVSQRGVVTLNAGDFTVIPAGCAYASVADEISKHISVLVSEPTPAVKMPDRIADLDVIGWLARHDRAPLVTGG